MYQYLGEELYTNVENILNIKKILRYNYTYSAKNSEEIWVKKIGDICHIEYLELNFINQEIIPKKEQLNNVKNIILMMTVGGLKVQQFPLGLLIDLHEPIVLKGKIYINLCFDMLFGTIKLSGLTYHPVCFTLTQNEIVSTYGITTTLTFVDIAETFNIQNEERVVNQFVQQLSFVEIKVDKNDETQKSDIFELKHLPFNVESKGFFIQCDDVDNVNGMILNIDKVNRLDWNHSMIIKNCKKINQRLLYMPFNSEKSYYERTEESYKNSVNFAKIYRVEFTITFNVAINSVKIYSLQSNLFRQMAGMGGLWKHESPFKDVYDLRNNQLTYPYEDELQYVPYLGMTLVLKKKT